MKPSISLLLIAIGVCITIIHAAPISRKSLTVTEPLGFLANFILKKRARAINEKNGKDADKAAGVQTLEASIVSETPFVSAASVQIRVKADPKTAEVFENKGIKNQVQNDYKKSAVDSSNSRSSSTTEASSWNWWQLNNKQSSESSVKANPVGHREIIKLTFRNDANINRRATGTGPIDTVPVEVVEIPIVDVTQIKEAPVEVADTVVEDISLASAGSSSSITEGSTVEKEASVKIVSSPKFRVLYEDKTPNFRVTLQVIEVEFDPVHTDPVPDAVVVDVKPAEIASVVDSSATASAAGTGETSAAGAGAVGPVTAISSTSIAEGTATAAITPGSALLNSASGAYVPQYEPALAGVFGATGATGASGVTGITGVTGLTWVNRVTGIALVSVGKPKHVREDGNSGGAGAGSDSTEEDD